MNIQEIKKDILKTSKKGVVELDSNKKIEIYEDGLIELETVDGVDGTPIQLFQIKPQSVIRIDGRSHLSFEIYNDTGRYRVYQSRELVNLSDLINTLREYNIKASEYFTELRNKVSKW